jgi:hypothetical protein
MWFLSLTRKPPWEMPFVQCWDLTFKQLYGQLYGHTGNVRQRQCWPATYSQCREHRLRSSVQIGLGGSLPPNAKRFLAEVKSKVHTYNIYIYKHSPIGIYEIEWKILKLGNGMIRNPPPTTIEIFLSFCVSSHNSSPSSAICSRERAEGQMGAQG